MAFLKMEPETLVFMPNGDVTLTLIRNIEEEVQSSLSRTASSSSLSELGESNTTVEEDAKAVTADAATDLETAEPPENEPEPEESELFYAPDPPTGDDGPLYPPSPQCRRGSDASSRRDRSASPPGSFWAALNRQKQEILGSPKFEETPAVISPIPPGRRLKKVVTGTQEVRCVVSSRHLMLASPHFQTLLSGDSNEAVTLRTMGHVTIQLSDDPDTLVILMNIIHGATRKVPRQVNLELLRKLAVLVKDFKMLESVEFFSDTWIDKLQEGGMPKSYSDDVLQLLFVFLVFDRSDEFKSMTRLIQRECDEKFNEKIPEIPVPHGIIDAIKRDRQFAIETAITVIHGVITRYMDGQLICDSGTDENLRFACDAMLLGSLMKGAGKIGIWPKPEAPFSGRKWNNLAHEIRNIKILDVCSRNSSRRWSTFGPSSNCHGLEDSIEDSMKSIELGLDGLKLSDYVNKSEDSWANFLSHITRPPPAVDNETTKEMVKVFLKDDRKERAINPQVEEMKETATREPIRVNEHVKTSPIEAPPAFQKHVLNGTPQAEFTSAQYDHGSKQEAKRAILQNDSKAEAPQAKPTMAYYERMRRGPEETPAAFQKVDKEYVNVKPNAAQYEQFHREVHRVPEEPRATLQSEDLNEMQQPKPTIFQRDHPRKESGDSRTSSPMRDWKAAQNGKVHNTQYEHVRSVPADRRATPPTPKEDPYRFSYPLKPEHEKLPSPEEARAPPTFEIAKQHELRLSPKFESPKQEEFKQSPKFGPSFFPAKSDITPAAQVVEAKESAKAESLKEERKISPTIDLKDLNTTTEEDDTYTQPQNFRARKSKKRFAVNRF